MPDGRASRASRSGNLTEMRSKERRPSDCDDGLGRVENLAATLSERCAQTGLDRIGGECEEVVPAYDDVLRREVSNEAEVLWGKPKVVRAAAEEALGQGRRRPLTHRAPSRRHAGSDDGSDVGIRKERDRAV
jgi:hypothetical protein